MSEASDEKKREPLSLFIYSSIFYRSIIMAYPTTGTSGMVGFATSGSTTGGKGGTVVSITSLNDLKTHVAGTDTKILVINANISASSLTKVTLGANKSIIGSYSSNTLTNIHFRSSSS
ncbi:hypothetical protein [Dickeya dianthicola]|uniref:hypothetical protein n=1 Tax=Dickeya dianthicola TaxID=204039 RepID=UPI001EE64D7E|nr:hypothetical protein [Dickeya dianthicola]MCI4031858.1 hypothetical protein [Dickeya dianthicola]MCI4115032.1 hypothetical protein [Dickeya dianthicola]MCI4121327.1 hypothetical protein [Dickeya dianthicola]MCI4122225.1 hypothetical protein [Dickeya dianthicola]MCI4174424.1 hypothetical protein [Dickeya dianthicola]